MNPSITSTSYRKKLLFDAILSGELADYKHKIDAVYEWKNKSQVFSAGFTDEKTIELKINLNIKEDLFSGNANAAYLSILYRSYFISCYLRCLENAQAANPDTLFQGLVVLEAIADIHAGEIIKLHSPLFEKASAGIKPISVYCAIGALSRIIIGHENVISEEAKKRCECAIDQMITYTRLPEVEYIKAQKPEYAVLRDLLTVKKLTDRTPDIVTRYSIFSQCGITSFDKESILVLLRQDSLSEFWAAAFLRVLAFSDNMTDVTDLQKIRTAIALFKEESVAYFRERQSFKTVLLADNMSAIKNTALKIDQAFFPKEPAKSGALHFIR